MPGTNSSMSDFSGGSFWNIWQEVYWREFSEIRRPMKAEESRIEKKEQSNYSLTPTGTSAAPKGSSGTGMVFLELS